MRVVGCGCGEDLTLSCVSVYDESVAAARGGRREREMHDWVKPALSVCELAASEIRLNSSLPMISWKNPMRSRIRDDP